MLQGLPGAIHTLRTRQRRHGFLSMLHGQRTGDFFNLPNNFLISNAVLCTETAPGHVTIAEDTSGSFLNAPKKNHILGPDASSLSGDALLDRIQLEWAKLHMSRVLRAPPRPVPSHALGDSLAS